MVSSELTSILQGLRFYLATSVMPSIHTLGDAREKALGYNLTIKLAKELETIEHIDIEEEGAKMLEVVNRYTIGDESPSEIQQATGLDKDLVDLITQSANQKFYS